MSVVEKAFELLGFFSVERPELGLSELRRLARRDKATTYRHLAALESVGLLEQDPQSRLYRIGPAVLRLAELREATTPRRAGALPALARLAELTGETAHASLLSGTRLLTLAARESNRHSTRVIITELELPLHATSQGHAVLAFGGPGLSEAARRAMPRFTAATPTTEAELDAAVASARQTGFGDAANSFEVGVHGIGVPVFDQTGEVAGAVAVATVASRMTPALAATIRAHLVEAARSISANWGGAVPPELEDRWARTLAAETKREASA